MKIMIIALVCACLCGCGNAWCIKVDGKYQDKTGGFEYCYDPTKGILQNATTGTKAVIVTKEELETIKTEASQVESKNVEKKKLIDQLLERVK